MTIPRASPTELCDAPAAPEGPYFALSGGPFRQHSRQHIVLLREMVPERRHHMKSEEYKNDVGEKLMDPADRVVKRLAFRNWRRDREKAEEARPVTVQPDKTKSQHGNDDHQSVKREVRNLGKDSFKRRSAGRQLRGTTEEPPDHAQGDEGKQQKAKGNMDANDETTARTVLRQEAA